MRHSALTFVKNSVRTGRFSDWSSEGTIAFICTTQADDLLGKLRLDIQKVCASGHPVHEIRAFALSSVPVATRHKLETETQESYKVRFEFHDAESIASLLAKPDGFWIAEQFLSIPAEIRPEANADDGDISAEYVEQRGKWRKERLPSSHPRRFYRPEGWSSIHNLPQGSAWGPALLARASKAALGEPRMVQVASNNARDTSS